MSIRMDLAKCLHNLSERHGVLGLIRFLSVALFSGLWCKLRCSGGGAVKAACWLLASQTIPC